MRTVLAALALLLTDSAVLAEDASDAICRVVVSNGRTSDVGTGFAVYNTSGGDVVLTNHHVIIAGGKIRVEFPEGDFDAKVLTIVSPRNSGDVAALIVPRRRGLLLRIRERRVRFHERIRWQGFVGGGRVLTGNAGNVLPRTYASGALEVRGAESQPGQSGSPAFDSSGEVVGIVWGGGGGPRGFPNATGITPFRSVNLATCIGSACSVRQYRILKRVPNPTPDKPVNPAPNPPPTDLTDEQIEQVIDALPPIAVVFHDYASWEALGADGKRQSIKLTDDKPTIHVPPVVLEMYIEQNKGDQPELTGSITERIGEPLQILNGLE